MPYYDMVPVIANLIVLITVTGVSYMKMYSSFLLYVL